MATTTKRTNTKITTKANTKTTVKSEPTTVEEVKADISVAAVDASVMEAAPIVTKEKKVFTDSDYILCRSVTSGGLNIVSQSGNLYEFNDYGSECEINYRDLVTLIRRGSEHIFLPRFVILDDDFLEDFPTVKKVYGEMYTMRDLEDILALPTAQMEREIVKLPESVKDSMSNLIAT